MDYVEQRMTEEAAREAASGAFATPLNFILLLTLLYTAYTTFLSKSPPANLPKPPPPTVFRIYNPHTLLPFNGQNGTLVLLAVRGRVFNVTSGRHFYGPGGPYANFAGRDASRGLACGSFDEEMLTKDLDGPLDTLADLGPSELEALQGWEETFSGKYDVIGKLVSMKEYNETDGKA